MSRSVVGLTAGMALGFAAHFGGLWAFVLVLALGVVGLVAGRWAEGEFEPGYFVRRRDNQQRIRDDQRRARRDWRR
ncbi:hypothetical protein [Streptomyces sp. NPDC053755]|uniref:hypothetical protein n=1 Tax=Streptomyces sp. NPDC053755 TaxID=3155815 RepID=UPI0034323889